MGRVENSSQSAVVNNAKLPLCGKNRSKTALFNSTITALLLVATSLLNPIESIAVSTTECVNVIAVQESLLKATETLNAHMSIEYPDLAIITRDPDAFIATMKARFEAQKNLTPEDPYRFDYFDVVHPVLLEMQKQVGIKTAELTELRKSSKSSKRQNREIDIALPFLADLGKEIDQHLADGKISYRRSHELSYFFGRVAGYFDGRKQSLVLRFTLWQDSYIQNGYRQFDIQKEYDAYKENYFRVFVAKTPVPTYTAAEAGFASVFFDRHELKAITFPTIAHLHRDIFFQLMTRKIYPLGVSGDPILADGTLRPSGHFWNHDIRHSSLMYNDTRMFIEKHKLTAEGYQLLVHQMDAWYLDFMKELDQMSDSRLRDSIWLVVFNFHHERGFPFAPSSYEVSKKAGYIPKLLYGIMKLNREIPKGVSLNLEEAYAWLLRFWAPKRERETFILNQSQVSDSILQTSSGKRKK